MKHVFAQLPGKLEWVHNDIQSKSLNQKNSKVILAFKYFKNLDNLSSWKETRPQFIYVNIALEKVRGESLRNCLLN